VELEIRIQLSPAASLREPEHQPSIPCKTCGACARVRDLAEAHKLYACHDRLLEHKDALCSHLVGRWRDLFNASFDVLLYDLTSTYFEIDAAAVPEGDKRRHGYSRDRRPDCPQVVIALVVTPEGLPLAYEVLPGNTADNQTLRQFLAKIEAQYERRVVAPSTYQVGLVGCRRLAVGIGFIASPCNRFRPRLGMFGSGKLYALRQ
jgi:hypothetical protein